jgi:hypothetical protein
VSDEWAYRARDISLAEGLVVCALMVFSFADGIDRVWSRYYSLHEWYELAICPDVLFV